MRINLLIFLFRFILIALSSSSSDRFRMTEEKNVIIFGSNNPGIFFFRSANTHSQLDIEFEKAFSLFDKKLNVVFSILDLKEEIEMRIGSMLFIRPNDLPIIKIVDTRVEDVQTFKMSKEINSENILNFIYITLNIKDPRSDL